MLSQYRKRRKAKLTVGAAWKSFRDEGAERVVLFWSGGKDSFLTLRALQRKKAADRITLLTTFDGNSGKIPFQETKVNTLQCVHEVGYNFLVPFFSENDA